MPSQLQLRKRGALLFLFRLEEPKHKRWPGQPNRMRKPGDRVVRMPAEPANRFVREFFRRIFLGFLAAIFVGSYKELVLRILK